MNGTPVRPPYDPQISEIFRAKYAGGAGFTMESLAAVRQASTSSPSDVAGLLKSAGLPIVAEHHEIPGYQGGRIGLSVLRGTPTPTGPLIYHSHGGGMVAGDRWSGITAFLDWIEMFDAAIVTVEYRLAPEFPDPFPREDAYAGLEWTVAQAERLNLRRQPLIVAGQSAGGGITASLALMARDRRGPRISGQLLLSPMLDDRDATESLRQFDGTGGWDRQANRFGWSALLGQDHGRRATDPYAAPARTGNLAGLPPAFLECGTAEVFRDETVAYAADLWAAGNDAELHMWAGGFHRYDQLAPDSEITASTIRTRAAWMGRLLRERSATRVRL
ncbi:alpha/beta hydrolase [Arthrobacter sp. zg-Y238]|uniref:alpha/beta hydrolase n=1 Tax=Arthrobacter sp. zg-Y238 TaxID=2964614 RepID=UPI00210208BE|nr:alpha/beta hydrolase [Arthrobacter sp. zg-Y238]MCQ1952217.1 alpha/beta hydrolase [Arthrobacter sp. zg-Y238]